jgi:AcrR family transcriptional regulator
MPAPPDPVRDRILRLAEERFLAQGFSRITMDDLAHELGMSKKTLYQHFPAKDALLDAMLERRLQAMGAELEALLAKPHTGYPRKLHAVLSLLSRRVGEIKEPFLLDLKRFAPAAFQKVDRFRQEFIPRVFGQLLEEGRKQGLLRSDVHPAVTVELLLTAIQSIIRPETIGRLNVSPHEAMGTIFRVILEGLLAPAGRRMHRRMPLPFHPLLT